jgi:transposase
MISKLIFSPNASEDYKARIHYQHLYTNLLDDYNTLQKKYSKSVTDFLIVKRENEDLKLENKVVKELRKTIEKIDAERNKLAKALNKRNQKKEKEYYGNNTPSSKLNNKPNSSDENKKKRGGGQKGHKGSGRTIFKEEADRIIELPVESKCCEHCSGELKKNGMREHYYQEYIPGRLENVILRKAQMVCSKCKKTALGKSNKLLPKHKYGNKFIAMLLTEHFVYGQTVGRLCEKYGVPPGTFHDFTHKVSDLLKDVVHKIDKKLLESKVIHADETTWSTDGKRGWAFGFFTNQIFCFKFQHSRGSIVPRKLFGDKKYDGVLVRDRYAAYNFIDMDQQYCYSHLIRNFEGIREEFEEEEDGKEVLRFVDDLLPLLRDAIKLKKFNLPLEKHQKKGNKIKNKILKMVNSEAEHPGVQKIQDIFRENKDRMFQWTKSPDIPAENNYAERCWRATVIARKISFGSQSEKGRESRERLMTFLLTAKQQKFNPAEKLNEFLQLVAENKDNTKTYSLWGK